MCKLMSIILIIQQSNSTGRGTSGMYNQSGYAIAVFVFIAFIILLIIAITPVKQNNDKL